MTTTQVTFPLFDSWAVWVTRAKEFLWLLAVFFVPLVFVTPAVMGLGHDIPKVTLYRSLVGLMAVLWIVEWGLSGRKITSHRPRLTVSRGKSWLSAQPTRWILVAACGMAASSLVSTMLSPSIPVSLWGRGPAIYGSGFYNTLSHFVLFMVLATHLKTTAQLWRLFGFIAASGGAIALYAFLQYYGLDPFGVHTGGGSVTSSLGNPIFTGTVLLMIAPPTLALALRTHGYRVWPGFPLLGIDFTQSRGPLTANQESPPGGA